ncbi:olfactory receptor 2D3-like [Pleurodeles waltl]|uniref:olfactory receptor 2D3-like n=1 Tax=Pleurodeles waltl TaxID=8319 RepID=UPI003709461C
MVPTVDNCNTWSTVFSALYTTAHGTPTLANLPEVLKLIQDEYGAAPVLDFGMQLMGNFATVSSIILSNLKGEAVALAVRMQLRDVLQQDQEHYMKVVQIEMKNGSYNTEFLLIGLSQDQTVRIFLFVLFLIVYMMTLIGNISHIIACISDLRLHMPMYFFLGNLSLVDICFASVIVPNMMAQLLVRSRISFSGCAAQMCTSLFFGGTECVLLAIMAYDRYVAITFPLHYTVIMRISICITLASCCWLCGSVIAFAGTFVTLRLPVCGSKINHFFCDSTALLKMACVDTYVTEMIIFCSAIFILLIPCLFTAVSYIRIIITVVRIRSSKARFKVFSTCASHLIIVTIFYSTAIYMYMKPVSKNPENWDKFISVFYTVTPPMLNPVIYSLRNKDVKMALQNVFLRAHFKCASYFYSVAFIKMMYQHQEGENAVDEYIALDNKKQKEAQSRKSLLLDLQKDSQSTACCCDLSCSLPDSYCSGKDRFAACSLP